MQKRTLSELNLMDDFLFFKMLNHSEFGEEFGRNLLKVIFGREFGNLKIIPQKVYYGSNTNQHGARLDVYMEETFDGDTLLENVTLYDVEPELKNTAENIASIPKRVRFYHSLIDASSLKAGVDYNGLKKVVVIMITPFDPFGCNRMIYTFKKSCEEVPELPYDDGAETIFLYTKGEEGNASKSLRELLAYMEDTSWENAKSDELKKIHGMVEVLKHEKETVIEHMKIFERERMLREEENRILREKLSRLQQN